VVFWDERFTSRLITKQTVQERGRRPGAIKRDSGAAALMLQEILDGLRQQQNR
jgi:RNase H-fold protein (predicted Holliday junction resolvase)